MSQLFIFPKQYFTLLRNFQLNFPGILLGIVLSCSWNIGKAQTQPLRDSIPVSGVQHEIGVSAGLTIGSGFAYRIWLRNFGVMVSLAPSWMENRESYLAGLSLYLVGYQNDYSKFFFYQGNHYMSSNLYRGYYGKGSTNGVVDYYSPAMTIKDRNWNHGIGVGYEIFRGPGKFNPFGLSMMVGWASYKNFTETNITGELALMYKFNRNAHLQEKKSRR
jgi:hypothetical protein